MPRPFSSALPLIFLVLVLLSPHLRTNAPAGVLLAHAVPLGADTSGRAVVVVEGGGSPHPYTTPWAKCTKPRPYYIQELLDAGLPTFTAPGYLNTLNSTALTEGCPPQPPVEVQWNTLGYPTSSGYALLGFLGYLHETYNYSTFDLVGYSYGGVISRAAIAALKWPPPANTRAPGFSYAWAAVDAGVTIASLTTMNSPHLGSPAYDIADNPDVLKRVAKTWGPQFARSQLDLVQLAPMDAGAISILVTSAHKADSDGWDRQQVGALEGVALTLMAGDYCGWRCGDTAGEGRGRARRALRQDGTVPVYSQLMEPCPTPCPKLPGSAYVPAGLVPVGVVRKTFPTVHSTFAAENLKLPLELSVSQNPAAVDFLVTTVLGHWAAAGAQLPV